MAQLKGIYINADKTRRRWKPGKLLVAITEAWWDDPHSWSAALDGCKLFGKDRPGSRAGVVALIVAEYLDCLKLTYSDDRVECWRQLSEFPEINSLFSFS